MQQKKSLCGEKSISRTHELCYSSFSCYSTCSRTSRYSTFSRTHASHAPWSTYSTSSTTCIYIHKYIISGDKALSAAGAAHLHPECAPALLTILLLWYTHAHYQVIKHYPQRVLHTYILNAPPSFSSAERIIRYRRFLLPLMQVSFDTCLVYRNWLPDQDTLTVLGNPRASIPVL